MYRDRFGINRVKVNLHMHTTLSDGRLTPEQAISRYREAGYDAVALTDHWVQGKAFRCDGVEVLSGCEFHVGGNPRTGPVYHIVGVGMTGEVVPKNASDPQSIIDAIHAQGGVAILAHPAWSFNTPAQILALQGLDAAEIYNTVSEFAVNYRADSSDIIDQVAVAGQSFPLVAADDAHYYTGDECKGYILAEAEEPTREAVLSAIREERFYASQGPELCASVRDGVISVDCSPAVKVIFHSGCIWNAQAVVRGDAVTHAEFRLNGGENFVRVSVTDKEGKRAWTNFLYAEIPGKNG